MHSAAAQEEMIIATTVETAFDGEEWTVAEMESAPTRPEACTTVTPRASDDEPPHNAASFESECTSECSDSEWKIIRDEGHTALELARLEQCVEIRRCLERLDDTATCSCFQKWKKCVETAHAFRANVFEMQKQLEGARMYSLRMCLAGWRECVGKPCTEANGPANNASHAVKSASAASPPPTVQEEERPTNQATTGVARLVAMGFSEEQARRAWSVSQGSMERAVQFLNDGTQRLQTLLQDARQRILDLKERLRDTIGQRQEGQPDIYDRAREGTHERLQKMHDALAEVRARLTDSRQHLAEKMQDGAANLKWRLKEFQVLAQDNVYSKEAKDQLDSLEAQLADAQQFLAETLQMLHVRAAATFSCERFGVSAGEDVESVSSDETLRAAMEASESAADVAIAELSECSLLVDESLNGRVHPPSAAPPEARKLAGVCVGGCGRPAAVGFATCCRTCGDTHSEAHGPRCQLKGIGRFLFQPNAARRLGTSARLLAARTTAFATTRGRSHLPEARRTEAVGPSEAGNGSRAVQEAQAALVANEDDVAQLVAMGFVEDEVRVMLVKCHGKKEVAIDKLLQTMA